MKNVSVADYISIGAETDATQAFQSAIDDCFLNGGGTVEVPKGEYPIGGIRLRSNVSLLLRSGARLLGSRNPEDYCILLKDGVEPIEDALRQQPKWRFSLTAEDFVWNKNPASRWNNGLIRAFRARNVTIKGEEGSLIDGMDCFDEQGEENYRGPHCISMHDCSNINIEGIHIQNSSNWAVALFNSQDIRVSDIRVIGGHDGVHLTTCDRAYIKDCSFFTGDDCVAGIDNIDVNVSDCELNTACSAFRIGGTHIHVSNCRMYGPARYLFRGSLSTEEKRLGKPSESNTAHRYNMLSAFTYYADFSRQIRLQPGDITFTDCTVENVDRFIHYNYSGNEPWQRNKPLKDMRFERITVNGLKMPLTIYGDRDETVSCAITDCTFSIDSIDIPLIHLCNCAELTLKNVIVKGLGGAPLIKRWSKEGCVHLENLRYDRDEGALIADTDEPFICKPI